MLIPTEQQQMVIDKWETHNLNHSEVGSGKTLMALESFKKSGLKKLVVVCLASKVSDWAFEGSKQGLGIITLSGSPKRRGELLEASGTQHVSISFQSSWRTPELLKFIDKDTMLVFDESHCLANRSANVTKFWMKASKKAGHTYLMSGTPISNGMLEQWFSQLKIAGLYSGTWKSFRERYCIEEKQYLGGRSYNAIVGYRNTEELNELLKEHSVAIKRDSKLIPSDIVYKVKSPSMVKKLRTHRVYETDSGDIIELDNPSKLFNALRVASNGFIPYVSKVAKNSKTDRLKDILEETKGERVVIGYQYKETCNRLVEELSKGDRPISIYNGSIKDLDAWEQHEDAIILVQFKAGSTGINFLATSHIMVFYELPLSSITYQQMKGRIARHTSTTDPVYYYLLADNEIEQKVYDSITNGVSISETMIQQWMEVV